MADRPPPLVPSARAENPFARYGNWVSIVVLLGVAVALFRRHLDGSLTFLGNPDRLNANLKILKYYIDSISAGGIQAWNEAEMLGYDSFAQPYIFPNPIHWLIELAGSAQVFVVAGMLSCILLGLAGITAFVFALSIVRDSRTALAAAILYQCSALSILKVSQNDMSFMVIVLIPAMALIVRSAQPKNVVQTYILGSLTVFGLLEFCFLQKVAYAMLFASAYALFLAWTRRQWIPLAVLAAATLTGILGAAPRIAGLVAAMGEYVRIEPAEKMGTFPELFRYQGIFGYQILRWFDDGILGRFFADPTARQNGLNLTEGFLLYTSAFLPFLAIAGMIGLGSRDNSLLGKPNENRFFLWFMLFTFAVALIQPVNYLIHLLFLKVDFVHARILVVGAIPMVVYAMLHARAVFHNSQKDGSGSSNVKHALAVLAGIAIAVGIELLARLFDGSWSVRRILDKSIGLEATIRVMLSGLIVLGLILGRPRFSRIASGDVLYTVFCAVVVAQALAGADFRLNGKHTQPDVVPFRSGDLYFAARSEFQPPTLKQRRDLHELTGRDRYRSIVICNPNSAGGFCAPHISDFWGLRLADGYYGIGVPVRLAMLPWPKLPWPNGVGLRQIIFTSREALPWELLGYLNVRQALIGDDVLYRNAPAKGRYEPEMIANPAPVAERVFFAQNVVASQDPQTAKAQMFRGGPPPDPASISFVEGLLRDQRLPTQGAITFRSHGDRFEISVEPAATERFLVINELFTPRWRASVDGRRSTLYPTNLVMRGITIPAGARQVLLEYTPIVGSRTSLACVGLAALLLVLVASALYRWSKPQ